MKKKFADDPNPNFDQLNEELNFDRDRSSIQEPTNETIDPNSIIMNEVQACKYEVAK